MPLELGLVPAELLEPEELEHTARVDHEVGCVEDAGRVQPLRVLGRRELVVRRAGHDPAAEARDRLRVQDAAHRAGGEDVALGRDRLARRHHRAADLRRYRCRELRVDVAHEHTCTVGREHPGEVVTHRADALHEDAPPRDVRRAEGVFEAGADAMQHAARRTAAAVAAGSGRAVHPGADLGDDVEVRRRDVHVARGAVAPAERGDELAVAQQQPPPRVAGRQLRHGEHRLAAAARHVRGRHLLRHRVRQPHPVGQAVRRRRVDAHARAAAGRSARRRVDADEQPRPALAVEADHRVLAVPGPQQVLEHGATIPAATMATAHVRYSSPPRWQASGRN